MSVETKRRIEESKNEILEIRHEIETTKAKLNQLKQRAAQKFHFVPVSHPPVPMVDDADKFYFDDGSGSGSGINRAVSSSSDYAHAHLNKPE